MLRNDSNASSITHLTIDKLAVQAQIDMIFRLKSSFAFRYFPYDFPNDNTFHQLSLLFGLFLVLSAIQAPVLRMEEVMCSWSHENHLDSAPC